MTAQIDIRTARPTIPSRDDPNWTQISYKSISHLISTPFSNLGIHLASIPNISLNIIANYSEIMQVKLVIWEIQKGLELNLWNFQKTLESEQQHHFKTQRKIKAPKFYSEKIKLSQCLLDKIMRIAVEYGVPTPTSAPKLSSRSFKSVLCFYYSTGVNCSRKTHCPFAHGERNQIYLNVKKIALLCPDLILNGFCLKGINCSFTHSSTNSSMLRYRKKR